MIQVHNCQNFATNVKTKCNEIILTKRLANFRKGANILLSWNFHKFNDIINQQLQNLLYICDQNNS